jgi:secreted trypsin-like serine protease
MKDDQNSCVYHLVGIVSTGRSCGTSTPSLYTKVSNYLNWIEEKVWPEEYEKV